MHSPNPAELTVVRAAVRDPLTGDARPGTEHSLGPCVWAPSSSTEQSARTSTGQQVVTRRDVFPEDPHPDVLATDRVRFPSETGAPWLVVGDVESWVPPWADGGPQGSKIVIERTTG